MTKQEFYDLAVRSSTNGTFPSYNKERSTCFFRKDKTANCPQRCSVGLLIPDEKYTGTMEGDAIQNLLIANIIELPVGMTTRMLFDCQLAHDNTCLAPEGWGPTRFVEKLNRVVGFEDVVKVDPKSLRKE